jgi:hypothetical protein
MACCMPRDRRKGGGKEKKEKKRKEKKRRNLSPVTGRGRLLCYAEDPTLSRQSAHRWRQCYQPYALAAFYSTETY